MVLTDVTEVEDELVCGGNSWSLGGVEAVPGGVLDEAAVGVAGVAAGGGAEAQCWESAGIQ